MMFGWKFPNAGEAVEYLKRRIVKEKDEEPRRNFVEDHQRIHYRKKNAPCLPILPGHDQEVWFAKLDSNGIWTRVPSFITNLSDMTSAYYSCEMFRKHLEDRRKMALLPKVLEVFRDTERLQYSGFGDKVPQEKQGDSREILKQRLVSKAWKKSFEDVFLVPLRYFPSRPIWHPENWIWKSPMVCKFFDVQAVENAIEKLQNTASCAPLLRVLMVVDINCDDKENFYSKLDQFIQVHGKSVWGLLFCNPNPNYAKLCKLVSRMPHLKTLDLYNSLENDDTEEGSSTSQIRQSILENPFPILSELESCYLDCKLGKNEHLVAEVLRQSPNLKAVHLDHYWNHGEYDGIPSHVWDALRNLRLEYFNLEYQTFDPYEFLDDFARLGQIDWPLKFLRVELYTFYDHVSVSINSSVFFKVIARFNDNLVEVSLEAESLELKMNDDRKSLCVDFPNLKKVYLPEIEGRD